YPDLVAGNEVLHEARDDFLVAGGGPDDVALREDADRPLAFLDDDERADVVLCEDSEGLADRRLGADGHDAEALAGQDVGDVHGRPPPCAALGSCGPIIAGPGTRRQGRCRRTAITRAEPAPTARPSEFSWRAPSPGV